MALSAVLERGEGLESDSYLPCSRGADGAEIHLLAASTPGLAPPAVDHPGLQALGCARPSQALGSIPGSLGGLSTPHGKRLLGSLPPGCSPLDTDQRSTSPSECVARTKKNHLD